MDEFSLWRWIILYCLIAFLCIIAVVIVALRPKGLSKRRQSSGSAQDEGMRQSPNALRLTRHAVAVCLVLLAQSPAMIRANGFLLSWLAGSIFALGVATLLTGLYFLFFTAHAKRNFVKVFSVSAWFIVICLLLGQWIPLLRIGWANLV
jgi:ABC-type Na+ efflux pump permease subunit